MKVGVFIQGQLRRSEEELLTTLRLLEDAFPDCEFCFSLWDTDYESRKEFVDEHLKGNLELFEEFDIGYEPYLDNPRDAVKHYQYYKKYDKPNPPRHRHQTKQMLLHNELMKKYGDRYDVIVRTRYDSTISPMIDFEPMLREVVETPTVVTCQGRSTLHPISMFNIQWRCSSEDPVILYHHDDGRVSFYNTAEHCMLADSGIIIHRPEDWDCDLVDRLHNTKKLLAAEFGWYQILHAGTSHKHWVEYSGGAMLTRCIPRHEREALKKLMETL